MRNEDIKTHRGKIRRETTGIRRSPEEYEKGLASEWDVKYDAWLRRRNLPRQEFSPSFRRNAT